MVGATDHELENCAIGTTNAELGRANRESANSICGN